MARTRYHIVGASDAPAIIAQPVDDAAIELDNTPTATHSPSNVSAPPGPAAPATPATQPPGGKTIADVRAQATAAAASMPGNFVGVMQSADGSWSLPTFDTRAALDDWYGTKADAPEAFLYLAAFDKTDTSLAGAPANEMFGAGKVVPVSVNVRPTTAKRSGALAAIVATTLTLGASVFAAGRKKGRR